jgi:protein-tyrosine phosphatase
MAEVVLRAAFEAAGLGEQVEVDSAGLGDWHVGDPADRRALATLRAHGFDGRGHRARQFRSGDWADGRQLVLAADRGHLRRLRGLGLPDDGGVELRLLRSFDPALADTDERDPELDLADPYYDDSFEQVMTMVQSAVPGIVAYVAAELR